MLKRTSIVKGGNKAMAWATNYIDEERKHKKEDLKEKGVGIGKHYFTRRPVGEISAHGFAKSRVETLSRVHGLKGNQAVLEFLREFCWNQQVKGRKKIGLRLVLSVDPNKVGEMVKHHIDLDQLMVKVAENTFAKMEELYYPGDQLGFIMGIHHDANTYTNKDSIARSIEKNGRQPKASDIKPHIHAHVLILSHTRNDKRVNLCDRTDAGEGVRLDRLTGIRDYYQGQVRQEIYELSINRRPIIAPEWEPIFREAATHTMEDFFYKEETIKSKLKLRRRVIDRFRQYVSSFDQKELAARWKERKRLLEEALRQYRAEPKLAIAEVKSEFGELTDILQKNHKDRVEVSDKILRQYQGDLQAKPVRFWDIPSAKATVLGIESAPTYPKNRTAEIQETFRRLQEARGAAYIQTLGELSLMSIKLAGIQPAYTEPAWIQNLARLAKSYDLPNQEMIAHPLPMLEPLHPAPEDVATPDSKIDSTPDEPEIQGTPPDHNPGISHS